MILTVLLLIAFLLITSTWRIIPSLYTDTTLASLSTRLMLGVAIAVCLMGNLIFFFSGSVAAWLVLVLFSSIAFFELALGTDKRSLAQKGNVLALAFLIGLSTLHGVYCLWPALVIGDLVPLEGTGNHDEFYYIFRAVHLMNNSIRSPFSDDILNPLSYSMKNAFTLLPRDGSECLIVFLSAVCDLSPEISFTILSAFFSILLVNASVIGLDNIGISRAKSFVISSVVISMSPVLLHINGNMNFAMMLGLVFLLGYYWFFISSLTGNKILNNSIASGVFLAALIITYPELLVIAFPASAIVVTILTFLNKTSLKIVAQSASIVLLAILVCCPLYIFKAVETLYTISKVVKSANVVNADYFSHPPMLLFLTLFFSDTQWIPGHLTILKSAVLICFMTIILSAPRIILIKTIPLLMPCFLMFFYFWKINYGYGGMKIMQFLSMPLAILFASGVVRLSLFLLKR